MSEGFPTQLELALDLIESLKDYESENPAALEALFTVESYIEEARNVYEKR